MIENTPPRQLPVRLPPHSDELLSSWISRHAAFYAVPPLVMLRHCLPEAFSLRAADLRLSSDQEIRLASMFATEPAVINRMTFGNISQSSHSRRWPLALALAQAARRRPRRRRRPKV